MASEDGAERCGSVASADLESYFSDTNTTASIQDQELKPQQQPDPAVLLHQECIMSAMPEAVPEAVPVVGFVGDAMDVVSVPVSVSSKAEPIDIASTAPELPKVPVHVEVCLMRTATSSPKAVQARMFSFLHEHQALFSSGPLDLSVDAVLSDVVDHANVSIAGERVVGFWQAELLIHIYQLNEDGAAEEIADTDEEELVACQTYTLPAIEFEGLWESLIFEENVQQRLLNYAVATMLFSDYNVNVNLVSWNRIILLFGPPGTGKTSLSKGLCQKLSIRLSHRFPHAQLVEINAHSLFSKWFSESGKLVMKLFQKIHDLIDDPTSLVFVLIDEVESLAAARHAALSGSEPSDSIRVVNALLTQLDQLKSKRNVIVFATSNIEDAIDLAFVDRADVKLHIGPPGVKARFRILRSCMNELIRAGIVKGPKIEDDDANPSDDFSRGLLEAASECGGLSGRALRRLPFQAQSMFLPETASVPCTREHFIDALKAAALAERTTMKTPIQPQNQNEGLAQ